MDLELEPEEQISKCKKVVFWKEASYFRSDCQITPVRIRRQRYEKALTIAKSNKKTPATLAEKIFDEVSNYIDNKENSAIRNEYGNSISERGMHIREEELKYEILNKKRGFTEDFAKLTEKHFGKHGLSKVSSTYESWTFYEPKKRNGHLFHTKKRSESSENSTDGQFANWRSSQKKSPRVSFSREPVNPHRGLRSLSESFKRDHSKSSSDMSSKAQTNQNANQTRKPPVKSILDILGIEYPEDGTGRVNNDVDQQRNAESCITNMVCIQVLGSDFCEDILLHLEELTRLKRDFPKLTNLIPDPNGAIHVEHRAEIVSELLRYMCGDSTSWTQLVPDWRTAVEMLSLTKVCKLKLLQKSIVSYFKKSLITEENAEDMFKLSYHFQVPEVLALCKEFLRELGYSFTELENDAVEMKKIRKTCTVSTFFYVEPDAFTFSLQKMEKDMAGSFHKDIQNEIKFTSINGLYEITGIELNLQSTDAKITVLDIYCDLSNESEGIKWDEYRGMKLDPVMVIKFKKKLLVKTGQTAVINVTIENLKPCLCSFGKEKKYENKSSSGSFVVMPTSTLKASDDYKVFFVEKILYMEKK